VIEFYLADNHCKADASGVVSYSTVTVNSVPTAKSSGRATWMGTPNTGCKFPRVNCNRIN